MILVRHNNGSDDGNKYRGWKTKWLQIKKPRFVVCSIVQNIVSVFSPRNKKSSCFSVFKNPIWFCSGETSYFDPNQLIPVLENRRYIFRAANDQIHVVEVITDPFGTSTKAYQIENVNESKQAQTNPTVAPSIKHTPAFPSVDSRLDAAAMKFINHSPYQIGSWLSHGFTSVVPPQTQFQHIFMPSPLPSMSIVVPFAVVFNPYASTSSSPSLIHNSEKPINPELINSIFQIPPNEHKNDNNHYTGGISTSLQPPFQTSTPPPQISSSTSKPSASSTPNYFGTNGTPTRPSYLPPTESAINNFDIRKFKFASTGNTATAWQKRNGMQFPSFIFIFCLFFFFRNSISSFQ